MEIDSYSLETKIDNLGFSVYVLCDLKEFKVKTIKDLTKLSPWLLIDRLSIGWEAFSDIKCILEKCGYIMKNGYGCVTDDYLAAQWSERKR